MAVGVQEQVLCLGVQEEALRWGVQEQNHARGRAAAAAAAAAQHHLGLQGELGQQEAWVGPPGVDEEGWLGEKVQVRRPVGQLGQVQWASERLQAGGAGAQEEAGQQGVPERLGVQEEHLPLGEDEEEEEKAGGPPAHWEEGLSLGGQESLGLLEEQGLGLSGQQEQGLSLGGHQELEGTVGVEQEVGLRAQHQPQWEQDVSPGLPPHGELGWGAQQAVQHSALQEGRGRWGVQEEGGLRRGVQEEQQEPEGLGWGVQEGAGNANRQQPQQG